MKIKYVMQPEPTDVDEFANRHKLTMKVVEREDWQVSTGQSRFYAEFEGAEVKIGNMLCGFYGNGNTDRTAIKDYFERIRGNVLVFNAMSKEKRKEIRVPYNLKLEWTEEA
jgi:hypothetical protein